MDSQEITAVDVILLASSPELEVGDSGRCHRGAVGHPRVVDAEVRCADIGHRGLDHGTALVDLTSREALGLPPGGQREDPLGQAHPADAQRVVGILREAGDKAVEGDGDGPIPRLRSITKPVTMSAR